ncbi:uncharacterized protein LOC123412323 [Hordeum vulgare subsp. vulgare]|nr:uncharacterized protein LOC123412323 [Hordeum vulgare subsp. vulgare]
MEVDAYHLRRSALTATAADERVDFATSLVAKALEQALDIPWESIQVASAHPEDYLIRFAEPYQRDLALERGYVRVGGVRLQLEQWDPAPAGTIRHLRFYCRLAISGIKFHAWRLDVVKKLLGGSYIVDRMERQTERLQNVAAFFVWVWTENPDSIPRAVDLTIIERAGDGRNRHQLPDGVPAEEGRQGPMTGVLIHLVLAKEYSQRASDSAAEEYPCIYTYDVQIGTMDGRVVPPRRMSEAGSSRLPRRRDDDADDEGQDRQRHCRPGKRRSLWQSVVGQAQCRDTARFDPLPRREGRNVERWGRSDARRRAPSRLADQERRWRTSTSPPPAQRRAPSATSSTAIPAGSVLRPVSNRSVQGTGAASSAPVEDADHYSGRSSNVVAQNAGRQAVPGMLVLPQQEEMAELGTTDPDAR